MTLAVALLLAVSFDCRKAVSVAEKRICASPELSRLDDQLLRSGEND